MRRVLYFLAKKLYRSPLSQPKEHQEALQDRQQYDAYRRSQLSRVLLFAEQEGIEITDKIVLDFGCNDGSITAGYLEEAGARIVHGVDVDKEMILKGTENMPPNVFLRSQTDEIPDNSIETIISFDCFEHVESPDAALKDIYRMLQPGRKALIGTWGWGHPYAPHLFSVMPVPWAHSIWSERTVLDVSNKVYMSPWFVPDMHDKDANGKKIPNKYSYKEIPRSYLNRFYIRDFERAFWDAGFRFNTFLVPFGSAKWLKPLLQLPWIREYLHGFAWFVLEKPEEKVSKAVRKRTEESMGSLPL